jgi:flagellar biosynthesis/type III secretory pathway M-ring protein FliF/YscJ
MLDRLLKKAEGSKSKILLFLLGILVALLIWYLLYQLRLKRQKAATSKLHAKNAEVKAANAKDAEEVRRHEATAQEHIARAEELDAEADSIEIAATSARERINAARSIDELAKL